MTRMASSRRLVVFAVAAACVAACGDAEKTRKRQTQGVKDVEIIGQGGDVQGRRKPEPGDKLYKVPAFNFLDAVNGRKLGLEELKGKVWVASFIFTSCKTHCIRMCGEMVKLQKEFRDDADFRIVQTTVDPARDTPEVLRQFGRGWKADPKKWVFLHGKRHDIGEFAKHGVKIPWQDDEPLNHSTRIVLVGREGYVRGAFDIFQSADLKTMRTTLRKVLDEKRKTP